MINVINFSDESFESQFVPLIEDAYSNASKLLDKLPESIDIKFTDNGGSDITGVGGFTFSKNQVNVAVLKNYNDRSKQKQNLYSAVLHEFFHVQQGFTYADSPFTALEAAIYEGCAVNFEREYAKNVAEYGDYSDIPETKLKEWLDEIRDVGNEYFENEDVWHKWAFYHPEYDQKWIIYKVGTWLVDNILKENNLGILDLKDKSAAEITKLIQF